MSTTTERKKCIRCKVNLNVNRFSLRRTDELKSTCNECLEKAKVLRAKNKCEHDRRKDKCKICGGGSLCIHDKEKNKCRDCGGSGICEHDRDKSLCKPCSGNVPVTIKNWIRGSRTSDKKYNRYDPDHFIDKCFLEGLIEDITHCIYEDCKVELQYVERKANLATIERIDNSIGHIKSNCTLCCWSCNCKKKSNRRIPEPIILFEDPD